MKVTEGMNMDIKTKINNLQIIHTGSAIFDGKEDKFSIALKTDNGLDIEIFLKFIETGDQGQKIVTRIRGRIVTLYCSNFNNPFGVGVPKPVDFAIVDDKHLYLTFWIYALNGDTKKLEYQFLMEE